MEFKTTKYQILQVKIPQLPQLQEIALETFKATYAHLNEPGNFRNYLERQFNETQLSRELENPSSVFFFLKEGDKKVGYFKLNWGDAQTESLSGNALELERIYVLKNHQGKGFGQKMIDFILEFGITNNFDFLWLGVWEKNPKAIRFYEKMGFKKFGEHIFRIGDEDQIDWMMKKSFHK
ncbi:GNAT family N-acetyltransferase [Flexithrix dorotheae]|uniref:GNAT family N-acetyltransferase n=1 Tax=Flexithrix dorotheae TaxID=70993 RepID=UPI000373097A|nr:GNAT family N-acetyltransferase [Flexithrix dorotheae]